MNLLVPQLFRKELMNIDVGSIRSPYLKQAYAYWEGKRVGRKLPSRADIDPAEMKPFLAHTLLVDVSYDPISFTIRLAGTRLADIHGYELTGMNLESVDLGNQRAQIISEYLMTVESGEPCYFTHKYQTAIGKLLNYERLLMPLSSDGESVDMLLGIHERLNSA